MSALISVILIIIYWCCGEPELIIGAGLFAIGAEINVLASRFKGR